MLCRRLAPSTSTHGSNDESRTARPAQAAGRGSPATGANAEVLRKSRRDAFMPEKDAIKEDAPRRLRATIGAMKSTPIALVIIAVSLAIGADAQTRAPQNDSITKEDLRADLIFLAGDSMRGRLTDTEENRAAADFIKSRFERLGLKPAGPNTSYFQSYNLMTATLADGNALDLASGDAAARHLRAGQEFYPHRYSASGHVAGGVVFVGFGIVAPHLSYDDYKGDIKGKIVLAL